MKRKDAGKAGTTRDQPHNQGEGDRESARRFNDSAEAFVNSERGRAAIDDAGDVGEDEIDELIDAEQSGRERAKEEDPAVTRSYRNNRTRSGKK
jgi:hypothetical protein